MLTTIIFCYQRNKRISLCTDICIALALLVVTLVLALAVLKGHSLDSDTNGEETHRGNEVNNLRTKLIIIFFSENTAT